MFLIEKEKKIFLVEKIEKLKKLEAKYNFKIVRIADKLFCSFKNDSRIEFLPLKSQKEAIQKLLKVNFPLPAFKKVANCKTLNEEISKFLSLFIVKKGAVKIGNLKLYKVSIEPGIGIVFYRKNSHLASFYHQLIKYVRLNLFSTIKYLSFLAPLTDDDLEDLYLAENETFFYDLVVIDNFSTTLIKETPIKHSIEFLSYVMKFPAKVKIFISPNSQKEFFNDVEKSLYHLPYLRILTGVPFLNLDKEYKKNEEVKNENLKEVKSN